MSDQVRDEVKPAKRSDLPVRLASALGMIAVATLLLVLGGAPFWVLVAAGSTLMVLEWTGLIQATPGRARLAVAAFIVHMIVAAPFLLGPTRDAVALLATVALLVMVATGSGRLGLGLFYVGLPAIGLLFLRLQPHGVGLTFWTLAIVVLTDTGAYFAGRAIGGPKLAPRLSPNKTWAGLGGGMALALVGGAIWAAVFGLAAPYYWLGVILAVAAQVGDLFESWLKRRAGLKDSGSILPGHGGVFDRMDGVVPVATIVAGAIAGGWL